MSDDGAVPHGVDSTVPSPARMYDYYLGGKDNYAVDREAAERLIEAQPQTRLLARNNRAFLTRAVRYLAEQGVEQFVDLGAGVPTEPAPHQTARAVRPEARVVYVDEDPVVLAHARALLGTDDGIGVVGRDALDADGVLADPELTGLIDFTRPVALLGVAVFHFSGGDAPNRVVARFRERMAPGSWLVVSSVSSEGLSDEQVAAVEGAYADTPRGVFLRSRAEIEALFSGFALVDPGLVDVSQWHGNAEQTPLTVLAGVGRLV